jgi:antitoxin (DNA-binding transcriptional repressor) of toxin-antitoxin stability system
LIREAVDGTPILLTRHGVVVVAVVPLQPGAYEEAVYPAAMRRVLEETNERQPASARSADLTDHQLAAVHSSGDPAVARDLGIDTTGWEFLNPQQDDATSDSERRPRPADASNPENLTEQSGSSPDPIEPASDQGSSSKERTAGEPTGKPTVSPGPTAKSGSKSQGKTRKKPKPAAPARSAKRTGQGA